MGAGVADRRPQKDNSNLQSFDGASVQDGGQAGGSGPPPQELCIFQGLGAGACIWGRGCPGTDLQHLNAREGPLPALLMGTTKVGAHGRSQSSLTANPPATSRMAWLLNGHYLISCEENIKAPQVVLVVKNPSANAGDIEMQVPSLGWEDALEEAWQPTPAFSPGESHGQRSLVRCSLLLPFRRV